MLTCSFLYISPPSSFRCVFDTGSVLLAVFSGNVSTDMVAKKTPEKVRFSHFLALALSFFLSSSLSLSLPPSLGRSLLPPSPSLRLVSQISNLTN